jgi:hypothetical protein
MKAISGTFYFDAKAAVIDKWITYCKTEFLN